MRRTPKAAVLGAAFPAAEIAAIHVLMSGTEDVPPLWPFIITGAVAGVIAGDYWQAGAGRPKTIAVYLAVLSVAGSLTLLLAFADLVSLDWALGSATWVSVPVSFAILAWRLWFRWRPERSDRLRIPRFDLLRWIQPVTRPERVVLPGIICTFAISLIESRSSPFLALDLLYLLIVLLVTARAGLHRGLLVGGVAAALHGLAQQSYPLEDIPEWVSLWNALALLTGLSLMAWLLDRLQQSATRERRLARTDELTGLLNRREFMRMAQRELERSDRQGAVLTLAMLDLDGFKGVNDRLGHATGDACLRAVASVLTERFRTTDVVARLGGDEFAVLLPDTEAHAAQDALRSFQRRLRDRMAEAGWPVSASVGLAERNDSRLDLIRLMQQVDERMYAAKRSGKNRVVASSGESILTDPAV